MVTRELIAAGERARAASAALAALLPAQYDNDPLSDRIAILAPDGLGGDAPRSVWRARRGGEPAGAVLSALAPDGYGGTSSCWWASMPRPGDRARG